MNTASNPLLGKWYFTIFFSLFFFIITIAGTGIKTPEFEPQKTSFELVNGMIIVNAEVDGVAGAFILDTGSPVVILNSKDNHGTSYQAKSLLGNTKGKWEKIDHFTFAGVRKFNFEALATDISHIEEFIQRPLKGLIGYEFFGKYDLILDFENHFLALAPHDFHSITKNWQLQSEVPFRMEGHLPVIDAKIGGLKLHFGLDTGSGTNLLTNDKKNKIDPDFILASRTKKVAGLGIGAIAFEAAYIANTNISGINYQNMDFLFSDLTNLKNINESKVDGLLGYPFFKAGKFTIDYRSKKLHIWE